jgi:ATP-binding cassette, subfamily F, member 3
MLKERFPGATQEQIYSQLSHFGIKGKVCHQTIKDLSGGQKSRMSFALLTWKHPHCIVMDEPTNHCGKKTLFSKNHVLRLGIDLDTIDGLIEAVNHYEGAIVVVSHDRFFLEKVCKEFWSVGKGRIRSFYEFEQAAQYSYEIGNIKLGK